MLVLGLGLFFLVALAGGLISRAFLPKPYRQPMYSAGKDWGFYRQELNKLHQDRKLNRLSQSAFDYHESRLNQQMLALSNAPAPDSSWSDVGFKGRGFILVFILISAVLFYTHWGQGWGIHRLYMSEMDHRKISEQIDALGGMNGLIERLRHLTEVQPENADAWYYLGRLYLNERKYQSAYKSLSHAVKLSSDKLEYILAFVASSVNSGHKLDSHWVAFLKSHEHESTENQLLVWRWLAMDATLKGNKALASQYWRRIIAKAPQTSPDAASARVALKQLF